MIALALGLGGLVLSVLVLPIEQLPHKAATTGRLVVGALLLIGTGALLGRAFLS